MTVEEFIIWLEGFLDGKANSLNEDDVKKIRNKINSIKIKSFVGPITRSCDIKMPEDELPKPIKREWPKPFQSDIWI